MFKQLLLFFTTTVSLNILASNASNFTQESNITVIGIGRLGLCFALCLENAGFNVMGIDINQQYVTELNNKTFNSPEPHVNKMLRKSSKFSASCSLDEGLEFSHVYYIAVDTPSTPEQEAYDHIKLNTVLREINKQVDRDCIKHVIIGCTVFPGYIKNTARELIKDCPHLTLSYNPSFIAQGNIIQGFQYPNVVLIGEGSKSVGDLIEKIHRTILCSNASIHRMSPESAEIAKLGLNCFITTKIAFANMIGDIADQTVGADKDAILNAIGADPRVGSKCLQAGYGFGGPCFPRDNRALGHYAETKNITPHIPRATDTANTLHAEHMVQQLLAQNKKEYTFDHVTYKDNCAVPIIEESQKLAVAKNLATQGKKVIIVDAPAVITEVQKKFGTLFEYTITPHV
jgi:UDPglucose 6-dehydrogenase